MPKPTQVLRKRVGAGKACACLPGSPEQRSGKAHCHLVFSPSAEGAWGGAAGGGSGQTLLREAVETQSYTEKRRAASLQPGVKNTQHFQA